MKHRLLFSVFLSLFFFQLSFVLDVSAQSKKVDAYIKSEMQRQNIPGLSLAIVREGKVIKAKGYGLANVETNVQATTETVKQFIKSAQSANRLLPRELCC